VRFHLPLIIYFCLIYSVDVFAKGPRIPEPDWKFVAHRLRDAGLQPSFVRSLKVHYELDDFTEILELNTLLFLRKTDYHGVQVTPEAATSVHDFVENNEEPLDDCEAKYGVTKEVVASLLWMESRHGKNRGQFHVASVFLDLVQADRPDVVRHLHSAAHRFTDHVTAQDRRDITSRAKKRVKWAIAELKAMEKMHKQDKNVVRDLHGSFAGAFGMAQFEPSSFVAYARAHTPKKVPNLNHADDAIQSVAYYLHKNGWKRNKPKSYVQSLMRYNNSHDYANAILKLADQSTAATEKSKRKPAGRK